MWTAGAVILLALAAAFLLLRGGEGPGFEEGDLLVCVNGDGSAELYWPKATAPSGMYRVEVTCGETRETRYCTQPALSLSGLPEGEELEFGGLFGSGPVMPVSRFSPAVMVARGGQIPAPIQSLRN